MNDSHDLVLPARVLLKDLGPALIVERLTDETFICAYEQAGRWVYCVKGTNSIEREWTWPKVLEKLEQIEMENRQAFGATMPG